MAAAVDQLELIVPGPPRGQERTRFARRGDGTVYTHTTDTAMAAVADIHDAWIAAGRPRLPEDRHFGASLVAMFVRPDGHFTKGGQLSAAGRRQPLPGKPDADNIVKLYLDALSPGTSRRPGPGAVPDDRLAYQLSIVKRWGATPRVMFLAWTRPADGA